MLPWPLAMLTSFCFCLGYRSGPLFQQVVPLHVSTRSCMSASQLCVIVISVLLAVGIITCVLSHDKMGARSWSDHHNRQQPSDRQIQPPCPQQQQYTYSLTPTTASMMYTTATVQERQRLEAGATQDHLVRIHSVQTDLALNLPHSISLPDGEEGPGNNTRFLKLRDPEQHAEVTRSFIRPPPNRTVPEGNSMLPFRSNSVGFLEKPAMSPMIHATDNAQAPLVTRSHSVSSSSVQGGRLCYPQGQFSPASNPNVLCQQWLPSVAMNTSCMSGTNVSSKRTYSRMNPVEENKYDSSGPPPPYSEVVNQLDVNTVSRQQNSGV